MNQEISTEQKPPKGYERLSKFMSWILRHGLIERSIIFDKAGYILLDDLMKQPEMKKYNVEDIMFIVNNNDKKRFLMKVNETNQGSQQWIRASQGHCKEIGDLISDDELLSKIISPLPKCLHGTNKNAWKIIKDSGLSAMGRKHIHFACGYSDDDSVISGMRKSSKVVIEIDMEKAMERGIKFYMSDNKVVLTSDDITPDLFKEVTFK